MTTAHEIARSTYWHPENPQRQQDEQRLQRCSNAVRAAKPKLEDAIREAHEHGMSLRDIAEQTDGLISHQTVRRIINETPRRH
jgi:DNA-directed RNA polymerase specialized sigma24 family protein